MKINLFQFLVSLFICYALDLLPSTDLLNWKHAAGLEAGCHLKQEHCGNRNLKNIILLITQSRQYKTTYAIHVKYYEISNT